MSESWRDVPGFEGRYQVSDLGRVRSLDHRVRLVSHGLETTRLVRDRILRPGRTKSGHVSVAIGKGNSRLVHQLVLEAFFVGPVQPRFEVLHRNHTPADNKFTNLKYGSRSENIRMDYQAGTRTADVAALDAGRARRWQLYQETRAWLGLEVRA